MPNVLFQTYACTRTGLWCGKSDNLNNFICAYPLVPPLPIPTIERFLSRTRSVAPEARDFMLLARFSVKDRYVLN